jgi:post-segregation antitoxin (ccd killing protein)
MRYIANGPKKPVNMTLSEDLVREARRLTRNLSDTVEQLLCNFVEQERKRQADQEHRIDATIKAFNEHDEKYGVWGDEYSTL